MSTETGFQDELGVILTKTKMNYTVAYRGSELICVLSSQIRRHVTRADVLAIGDRVRIDLRPDGIGVIREISPRGNCLTRRSAVPMPISHGAHPYQQLIAANVDQVVAVFAAANPPPKWNLLDRYLVSAESLDIQGTVCITKLDLGLGEDGQVNQELADVVHLYRQLGYSVWLTSVETGQGIEEFRAALRGKVSVMVGKSGVGKTTLLNALQPGLGLRVQQVSQVTGKGRHTTTAAEMYPLEFGGAIIDTPGIREFGLWDVDSEDLAEYFPEMRPFIGRCRFGLDCLHQTEPGCAIRQAVSDGKIHPRRYESYLRLCAEGYEL